MKDIFLDLFAKDRPLRHYTQHLLIAIVTFFVAKFLIFREPSLIHVLLFFVFTFLIDLDGVFTVLLSEKDKGFKDNIIKSFKKGGIKGVAIYATRNHKKIDNLFLHNFNFYLAFLTLFVFSLIQNNLILGYISFAISIHMTFDILDDIVQLGHVKNWIR